MLLPARRWRFRSTERLSGLKPGVKSGNADHAQAGAVEAGAVGAVTGAQLTTATTAWAGLGLITGSMDRADRVKRMGTFGHGMVWRPDSVIVSAPNSLEGIVKTWRLRRFVCGAQSAFTSYPGRSVGSRRRQPCR